MQRSMSISLLTIVFAATTFSTAGCRPQGHADSVVKTDDQVPSQDVAKDTENTKTYKYVHYNIKELTTAKIIDAQDVQTTTAAAIVGNLKPDFLSINEMQYDKKDIPVKGLPGTGQNMRRFLDRAIGGGAATWQFTFGEANTGKNAKRQTDGNYAVNPNAPASRALADQVNFGTFPGQYSTGFASSLPIKERIINNKIKWIDWDKSFPFANHKLPDGKPLPSSMSLFDKNFNDSLVEVDSKPIHFVTYHTVPAFDFGAGSNTNVLRNQAQLEFLEWYLLGSCEPANSNSPVKQCKRGIKPLTATASFIAIGDLNVDYNSKSPGADVMRRLLQHARTHDFRAENPDPGFVRDPATNKSHITYLSDGTDLGKLQSNLDYFIVSKDLNVIDAKVHVPGSDYKEESCHDNFQAAKTASDALNPDQDHMVMVSTRYLDNNQKKYCAISVSREFAEFRKGSDHLPVYLIFNIGR